ncbi:MAG: LptF/LptG family permease [bacterium]
MRILSRYMVKQLIPPFFFGLGVFTLIFLADQFIRLAELIFTKGVDAWMATQLILLFIPSILALTIPMAVLLAVVTTFGRMSSDNEITAVYSSGVSAVRLFIPVIIVALLVSAFLVYFYDQVLPRGNYEAKKVFYKIVRTQARALIRRGIFSEMPGNLLIYIKNLDDKTGLMKDVIILQFDKQRKEPRVIVADEGVLVQDDVKLVSTLKLSNGMIHQIDAVDRSKYDEIIFKEYELAIDISDLINRATGGGVSRGTREKTIREIAEDIEKKLARNETRRIDYYRVELYKRISYPFAALAFALIGAPLGVQARRSGRNVGYAITVVLITIYYALIVLGEQLGSDGVIRPIVAVWIGNIVFAGLGVYFMVRVVRESAFTFMQWGWVIYINPAPLIQRLRKRWSERRRAKGRGGIG